MPRYREQRLLLRRIGKHHGDPRLWLRRHGVNGSIINAFQRNVWPRHYGPEEQEPPVYWQVDNYVTGEMSWHGPILGPTHMPDYMKMGLA